MEPHAISSRRNPVGKAGANLGANRASAYLNNSAKTHRLLDDAMRKAGLKVQGSLHDVWDSFTTLLRMIKAYVSRKYTKVPWKSMLYAVGAVVYFVAPIDFIPDFIAGIGFLDDAAVIGWVANSLRTELNAFREWEAQEGTGPHPVGLQP
jgi:uncharacterized membrane protein YkvA (DUF1232 family)